MIHRPASAILAVTYMLGVLLSGGGCGGASQTGSGARPSASMEPARPSAGRGITGNGTEGEDTRRLASRPHPPVLGEAPYFGLEDEKGDSYGADDLLGYAYVIGFLATEQAAENSKHAASMRALEQKISSDKLDGQVRLVSVLARRSEAPRPLDELATQIGADRQLWRLLQGPAEKVKELRDGLQIQAPLPLSTGGASGADAIPQSPLPEGALFFVDSAGRIRGKYGHGEDADLDALTRDLRRVLTERVLLHADLVRPNWLTRRKQAQVAASNEYRTRCDFRFTDRRRESSVSFRHRIVDDAGRSLVTAHYDHGNGLAVADVDGDNRLDIYFVNQIGPCQLWRNLGDGRFEDMTAQAGVAISDHVKVTASFADTDNDGDADLFVTTVRGGNVLFENTGKGVFRDITKEAGLEYVGHSSSAVFFDYNRDGLLDLFLVNVGKYTTEKTAIVENDAFTGPDRGRYSYFTSNADAFAAHLKPDRAEQSILYENRGGNRFVDVSQAAEIEDGSWSGDALAFDGNNDLWPDLYLVNMQGHDEYYENDRGRRFLRKSRQLFPQTPWGTMGIGALDLENDGLFDLFLTDMHTDMMADLAPDQEKSQIPKQAFDESLMATDGNHVWGNAFFRNRGGAFVEAAQPLNAETYWPWGLTIADLNADGFEDALITAGMNFPFRYGINSLLLNENGERFRDAEFVLGVEPRRGGKTAIPWFELDAEGADRNHPIVRAHRQKGLTSPTVVVWGALGSRSSAALDLEHDGDLDIVTSEFNAAPMVLVSDLSERGHLAWMAVQLRGTHSNRDGLGAVVSIQAEGKNLHQVHDGKSGYLSQSRMPLYFGLGDAAKVDRIEIRWPSGKVQTLEGPIEINQMLEIQEP